MIIVLDSNEYINYLSKETLFLDEITRNDELTIYINETITKEVLNNINEQLKKRFYDFLFTNNIIAYDQKLPFGLIKKYKELGLKKGDITIAAFCEHIKVNYLITENRHFLRSKKFNKFKVLSLKEFWDKIS